MRKRVIIASVVVLALVLIGVISAVAYIIYEHENSTDNTGEQTTDDVDPTSSDSGDSTDPVVVDDPDDNTPQAPVKKTVTIKAIYDYPSLKLEYPSDWVAKEEVDPDIEASYTFEKEGSVLSMRRIQGGGEGCVFHSDFDPLSSFLIDISSYNPQKISSGIGDFYYYYDSTKNTYSFCGPSMHNGELTVLNSLGFVTFSTDEKMSSVIFQEMEAIIASVTE